MSMPLTRNRFLVSSLSPGLPAMGPQLVPSDNPKPSQLSAFVAQCSVQHTPGKELTLSR